MPEQTNSREAGFPSDLLVDLRPESGRGLRERLEHGLRTAIQSGRLAAGTPVPPTRVLAGELGVSRSVVVEAYANLTADGYLEARQGAGTQVRADGRHRPQQPKSNGLPTRADFFTRPRQASPVGTPPIRMLGGLPDPALFPRAEWARHYRAALADIPDPDLTYPSTLGAAPLRVALTAYLGRVRGVATEPERMLIAAGYTQALTLLCRALARGGAERVAIEDPCFGLHRRAIKMTGLEVVPVAVDDRGIDVTALEALDVQAVMVAPAHSYPQGSTLDAERRGTLVDWAAREDVLIVEDDYDAEFRYDRVPVGALQGLAPDRVVYIGSASKTVSPALRLGWMAMPEHLVERVEVEKRFDDMGSALLEQLAFARFVEGGDFARYLRRVRPIYRSRRDATIDALEDLLPELRWQGAAAGLHLHVLLPAESDERAVTMDAYDEGLVVEDGAWHWADRRAAPPSLVLGYGALTEPAIRRAIETLARSLQP